MSLYTSVFVYVGSIGLYKRIVNADTQSIRIANADGQGNSLPRSGTPSYPRGRVAYSSTNQKQSLPLKP